MWIHCLDVKEVYTGSWISYYYFSLFFLMKDRGVVDRDDGVSHGHNLLGLKMCTIVRRCPLKTNYTTFRSFYQKDSHLPQTFTSLPYTSYPEFLYLKDLSTETGRYFSPFSVLEGPRLWHVIKIRLVIWRDTQQMYQRSSHFLRTIEEHNKFLKIHREDLV